MADQVRNWDDLVDEELARILKACAQMESDDPAIAAEGEQYLRHAIQLIQSTGLGRERLNEIAARYRGDS